MLELLISDGIILYLSEVYPHKFDLFVTLFVLTLSITLYINLKMTSKFHQMIVNRGRLNEEHNEGINEQIQTDNGNNHISFRQEYFELFKTNIVWFILLIIMLRVSGLLFSTFAYIILLTTQSLYILMLMIYYILFIQLKVGNIKKPLNIKGLDIIMYIVFIYLIQGIESVIYIINLLFFTKLLNLIGSDF